MSWMIPGEVSAERNFQSSPPACILCKGSPNPSSREPLARLLEFRGPFVEETGPGREPEVSTEANGTLRGLLLGRHHLVWASLSSCQTRWICQDLLKLRQLRCKYRCLSLARQVLADRNCHLVLYKPFLCRQTNRALRSDH